MTTELMSLEYAEKLAAAWAHLQEEHKRLDEMFKESTGRKPDDVKAILRQMMNLDDLDEIIDPETGRGVHIDPPSKGPDEWDMQSMGEDLVLRAYRRNSDLLTVNNKVFNATDESIGGPELDEMKRYRIKTQRAGAFKAVIQK